ncbi:lamin tail domain-containing protein [Streptomyces sp. NPDC001698]|uniref:lamin tail domain-containing protein n=1 Tax=Streptomyces sp. NPDC001698 TaxID=3364601 RepID=UPI0036ACAF39
MTARRLAAAVAAAGALVGTVALPASAADHAPRSHRENVVISNVHLGTEGRYYRSNRALNQEWVAITNNSRQNVNLSGWTLSDKHGHTYTFRHFRLSGHDTVRVHTGVGRDTRNDLFQDRRNQVWDRRDTATLRNERGRVVDTAAWNNDRYDPRDTRGSHNDRHDPRDTRGSHNDRDDARDTRGSHNDRDHRGGRR